MHAKGPRIITFSSILKYELFPLAPLLEDLLKLCESSMGSPVEIEFALDYNTEKTNHIHFGFLQVRPMVSAASFHSIDLSSFRREDALCYSDQVLGNGIINDIQHIVYVNPAIFDASKTREIALEVEKINDFLKTNTSKYLLIGPGRWGSSDPWLGIPVQWGQISESRAIIEANLENMMVDPSQGSHFFQNITSLGIGYFTVPYKNSESFIDWDWLLSRNIQKKLTYVTCVKLDQPMSIQMDGKNTKGIILKSSIERQDKYDRKKDS